jgi:ureidoglycolate lyase
MPKFRRLEGITLKILRFNDDRIGVIKNAESVVDVSNAVSARKAKGPQRVMEEIIEGWRKYRRRFEKILAEQEGVPLSSVQLLCPLPRPSKCLAAFANYVDRPDRSPDTLPNEYFYKSPDLVGPGGTIELRDIPAAVVYQPEAEFAFVIGKTAKDVPEAKALDYVFGYVPFFDVSTRGLARRTQFVPKGQDSHGACGPWIITKDEIPDPQNLAMWLDVDDRRFQDGSTKTMIFGVAHLVSHLSRYMTLLPGDVISTGTPPGVGVGVKPTPVFLKPGNVMRVGIEGLGEQRQEVAAAE